MKKIAVVMLAVGSFLFTACGGGSDNNGAYENNEHFPGALPGNSSTPSTAPSARITGTVPGTYIEAYCDDGTYAHTVSNNNGTVQHPFSLQVPINTPCRLVMTTNPNNPTQRVVTPVKINGKRAIKISGDSDLGYVDLPATYAQANDRNGDHLNDQPVNVVPVSLQGDALDDQNNPFDRDGNGLPDSAEDRNGDHTPDGWEDRNGNGRPDIMDDTNGNGRVDGIENVENGMGDTNGY